MSAPDMKEHSETNWARVDALTDDTIDTSDIPPLTSSQLARLTLRLPRQTATVSVNVDPVVLAWFKAQGDDLERSINAALRMYLEAHDASGR